MSDSRAAFEHAISERGLVLAKGDHRGHVAVSHDGEVLSIARYVGKKAKEVREKLGEPDDTLPSVDDAKSQMAQDMTAAFYNLTQEAEDEHAEHMQELDDRRQEMTEDHRDERHKLDIGQQQRFEEENRIWSERLNNGLRGLWDRITGRCNRVQQENARDALESLRRNQEQRDALVQAQLEDRRHLQAEIEQERLRQTELLQELEQDSKPYRDAYAQAEVMPVQPTQFIEPERPILEDVPAPIPLPKPIPEPTPEPLETPESRYLTQQFHYQAQSEALPVQPSPEERLQAIRGNQAPDVHHHCPEHER